MGKESKNQKPITEISGDEIIKAIKDEPLEKYQENIMNLKIESIFVRFHEMKKNTEVGALKEVKVNMDTIQ